LSSVHVTAWRVLENNITTKDNLIRHGVAVESNLCCFYGVQEENLNNLFFGCIITSLVWNLSYVWLGMLSVDPINSYSHVFAVQFV